MWRLILFHTEKEEPVSADAQKHWHQISLLLGVQFMKAAATLCFSKKGFVVMPNGVVFGFTHEHS